MLRFLPAVVLLAILGGATYGMVQNQMHLPQRLWACIQEFLFGPAVLALAPARRAIRATDYPVVRTLNPWGDLFNGVSLL